MRCRVEERELRELNGKNGDTELVPCIADVGDRGRMERVFASGLLRLDSFLNYLQTGS